MVVGNRRRNQNVCWKALRKGNTWEHTSGWEDNIKLDTVK